MGVRYVRLWVSAFLCVCVAAETPQLSARMHARARASQALGRSGIYMSVAEPGLVEEAQRVLVRERLIKPCGWLV